RITEIMNEYFTAMAEVIMRHHGLVNDFIGDGILAVYGAAVDVAEPAQHAAATALDVRRPLAEPDRVEAARGAPTLALGAAINSAHGPVELRSGGDCRRAGPLQALRAGDALRVTDDAVAVVMLSGGGTVKVQVANSPYMVAARADDTRTQKARTLVQAGLGFMAAGQREAPTAVLSTRSAAKPPVVIAPRNTSLLPGPIALEWAGSR